MQRRDAARTALSLALGLLMVVLGIILVPQSGSGTTADDSSVGRVELVAHPTVDQAVAGPGRVVQPAPGGLFVVLTAVVPVCPVLVRRSEPTGFRGESWVVGHSTRPVRAPPVSLA
jgi:hypothetical protein